MGIHDRDYYRESSRGLWDRWSDTPATFWLLVVTIGVFFLQLLTYSPAHQRDILTEFGSFYLPAVLDGQVWRVLTSHFLHDTGSLWHLAMNMLLLYWVGREVEAVYGSREFLTFYLTTALVVSLGKIAIGLASGADTHARSLGASGPVTAVFILFACHYPHRRLMIFGILPAPAYLVATGVVLLDMLGFMGLGVPGIGHLAHLLGAAFAVAYFRFHLRISSWIPRFGSTKAGRRVAAPKLFVDEPDDPAPVTVSKTPVPASAGSAGRNAGPTDEQLEAKLDEVLEKMKQFGKESLTPEEQNILLRASEVYKRRRRN